MISEILTHCSWIKQADWIEQMLIGNDYYFQNEKCAKTKKPTTTFYWK